MHIRTVEGPISSRFYVTQGVFALMSICAGIVSFARYSISTSILLASVVFIACNLFRLSFLGFASGDSDDSSGSFRIAKPVVASILGGIVIALTLEALTVVGSLDGNLFDFNCWSKKRLVVFFFLGLYIASQLVAWIHSDDRFIVPVNLIGKVRSALGTPLVMAGIVFCVVLLSGVVLLVNPLAGFPLLLRQIMVLVLFIFVGICLNLFLMRGNRKKNELVFLVDALLIGTFLSFALPPLTAISPDDQIHFDRSLTVSYLWSPQYTEAERSMFAVPWVADGELQYDSVRDFVDSMDVIHESFTDSGSIVHVSGPTISVAGNDTSPSISYVGYLPAALGLWLSRLFGFTFSLQVMFGRWVNLVFYVLVIYAAIRILPRYKGLACLIGLLPTSLYIAANYSYDPWVISLMMLALALVFEEIEAGNRRLTSKKLLLIALVFFLALAPKAIYFPMVGIMLLLPKTKFDDDRNHKAFFVSTCLFALFLVATFILPMLFTPEVQAGDIRGGSDVNSVEQIKHILSHPISYLKTLGGFMLGYLSPVGSNDYTMHYAYMGDLYDVLPWMSTVPFIVLVIAAVREPLTVGGSSPSLFSRIWVVILSLGCVVLVATSMYVAFTPVGSDSIAGCQARYILPVALPLFTAFCSSVQRRSHGLSYEYWIMPAISVMCIAALVVGWQLF